MASRFAAEKARGLLASLGWPEERIGRVRHAIEAHSFSAGIAPESLEARILQDADRLDAIGFVGVARCFWLAGNRGAAICHSDDPGAEARELDEVAYALDHFQTKLLGLDDGFCTATGRELAAARAARLRDYFLGLLDEVG